MRAYEILLEGVGLPRRWDEVKQGKDVIFSNAQGEEISLKDMVLIPNDAPKFEDDKKNEVEHPLTAKQKTEEAIHNWAEENGLKFSDIQMTNSPLPAAIITVWEDENEQKLYFGRYFNKLNQVGFPATWNNTQFKNSTGYGETKGQGQRAHYKLEPSLFFNDNTKMNSQQMLERIKNGINQSQNIPDDMEPIINQVFTQVTIGDTTPVPGAAQYREVFEVILGEMAGPLAIMENQLLSGSVDDMEEYLLKPYGKTLNDINQVSFPLSANEKLIDSFVYAGDVKIGVSSKSSKGKGAQASIVNILDIIDKKKDAFDVKWMKKNQKTIEYLRTIKENSAKEGPLNLAVKAGLISEITKSEILDRLKTGDNNEATLHKDTKKLLSIYPKKQRDLDRALTHPQYRVGYRLLAAVAREVESFLNENTDPNFYKDVLSKGDIIQVYAKVNKKGDGSAYTNFNIKYPPTFTGEIKASGSVSYWATGFNGKMTIEYK